MWIAGRRQLWFGSGGDDGSGEIIAYRSGMAQAIMRVRCQSDRIKNKASQMFFGEW